MNNEPGRYPGRGVRHEVNAVLTTSVVAEFCHRRMMQEAQSRGLSGSNPAKALAQNPGLVRQLTQHSQEVEDLLSGDLLVLALESTDFTKAADLQRTHGLLTNDSLNLAVALRVGVNLLATADPQFDSMPGFTVFKPEEV